MPLQALIQISFEGHPHLQITYAEAMDLRNDLDEMFAQVDLLHMNDEAAHEYELSAGFDLEAAMDEDPTAWGLPHTTSHLDNDAAEQTMAENADWTLTQAPTFRRVETPPPDYWDLILSKIVAALNLVEPVNFVSGLGMSEPGNVKLVDMLTKPRGDSQIGNADRQQTPPPAPGLNRSYHDSNPLGIRRDRHAARQVDTTKIVFNQNRG